MLKIIHFKLKVRRICNIFDYDNSKDYRIIIANKKGKILNYKKNEIESQDETYTDNKLLVIH